MSQDKKRLCWAILDVDSNDGTDNLTGKESNDDINDIHSDSSDEPTTDESNDESGMEVDSDINKGRSTKVSK